MPNKTVYISPDNEEAWKQFKVQNGSLNSFLSMSSIARSTPVVSAKDVEKMNEPGAITPAIKASEKFAFCKHGAVIGFCKKGC